MLKGSIVALVTPFNIDGSINYEKLEELLLLHDTSSDGILILGTTGEAEVLSLEEKIEVVKFARERVKNVPLVVGAGSNITAESVKMAKAFSELGADYLLAITPYYNKTNDVGLVMHFEAIAEASSCPIILYNVPSRTCMNISPDVVEKLHKNPKIYGIKEASGNMSYAMKLLKYLSDDFVLISGNDDLTVPLMSIGAVGVISVLANIAPVNTKRICDLCFENNFKEATELAKSLLKFTNLLFSEVNPIPIKEAMNYIGMEIGNYRPPLTHMSPNMASKLFNEIDNIMELLK